MPVAPDRLTAGENLFPLPSEPCLQRALHSFGVALARSNPIGWSQECPASNEGFERASATPNECNARCRQGSEGSGNKFYPSGNRSVAACKQKVRHTARAT